MVRSQHLALEFDDTRGIADGVGPEFQSLVEEPPLLQNGQSFARRERRLLTISPAIDSCQRLAPMLACSLHIAVGCELRSHGSMERGKRGVVRRFVRVLQGLGDPAFRALRVIGKQLELGQSQQRLATFHNARIGRGSLRVKCQQFFEQRSVPVGPRIKDRFACAQLPQAFDLIAVEQPVEGGPQDRLADSQGCFRVRSCGVCLTTSRGDPGESGGERQAPQRFHCSRRGVLQRGQRGFRTGIVAAGQQVVAELQPRLLNRSPQILIGR